MFRKIVVPIDTSPLSEQAAWKAGALARSTSASVYLLHVYEPPFEAVDGGRVRDAGLLALDRAQKERHVRLVAHNIQDFFGCAVHLAILNGLPIDAIKQYVRDERADLIVMSTHGRTGMSRVWFGSVADTLARESSVPVLLVRPPDGETILPHAEHAEHAPAFHRVLIALDGSDTSAGILETVRAMSVLGDVHFLLVEVVRPVPLPVVDFPDATVMTNAAVDVDATAAVADKSSAYLSSVAQQLRHDGAANVATDVVVAPSTAPAIVALANAFNADLIALTSHGRGASRLLIGSVGDKILRGTHCSVLLRRAPAGAHPSWSERVESAELEGAAR